MFMRIQPSPSDRLFISWKHNVLFSIYQMGSISRHDMYLHTLPMTQTDVSLNFQCIYCLAVSAGCFSLVVIS